MVYEAFSVLKFQFNLMSFQQYHRPFSPVIIADFEIIQSDKSFPDDTR